MSIKSKLIILLTVFCSGLAGGWLAHYKFVKPREIISTKIETKIVYRDYKNTDRKVLIEDLKLYDLGEPKLFVDNVEISGGLFSGKTVRFENHAALSKRKWTRQHEIEVGSSANWKYFIGAGFVVGALGAWGCCR